MNVSAPLEILLGCTENRSQEGLAMSPPAAASISKVSSVITGELKSKIDRVWDAFWSGGISNPLEVIEQITYLLFIRRLDDIQTLAEKKARVTEDRRREPGVPARPGAPAVGPVQERPRPR